MNPFLFLTARSHFKNNFLASITVFLVAVPLCLGVAIASGAPLFAGIITGVIGGIVVGALSDSPLSISGPAAGMVAVAITALHQLGSYDAFLFALVVAGAIQIMGGILRAGFVANFVPVTVIKGLLAAIGILIVVKQLPLALGYYAETGMLQKTLEVTQENFTLPPIFDLFQHINKGATFITVLSLCILSLWDKHFHRLAKTLPSAMLVVVTAVIVNLFFHLFIPALALQPIHLVNIPVFHNWHSLLSQFQHPDFQQWNQPNSYLCALMIAVVASLETLLNLEAVEKLDKQHHYCSRNKELFAQGVGNILSGLVGGLPITSAVVRSSVNINAGASSKLSTILHGVLLFLSLSLLANWFNYIPLAALAAILIHTGYKLARLSLFAEVYAEGWRYFIPFVITVIAIVFTDLLLGIIIGLLVSSAFILYFSSKNCFTVVVENHPSGKILRLILPQQVTFINKASIIERLNQIPQHTKVIIDAKFTDYIDNDILDVIKEFKESQGESKHILLNLEGFKRKYNIDNQTSFISATTYDVQSTLTPERILKILQEGNHRFIKNTPIHKNYKQQITATSDSQYPIAVILSCIDSRVPVEIVFDLSLGDIFSVRIAGNIANEDIVGSIEYACKVAGAKLIVVLGHKECGAIKAACDNIHLGHITQLLEKIQPAIELETKTQTHRDSSNEQFVTNVTSNNIELTQQYLYQKSAILKDLIDSHEVCLIGALYDIHTGRVEFTPPN